MLPKFQFSPFSRPIYKNIYRFYGSGPTGSVFGLSFTLACRIYRGIFSSGKMGPFEIYLPVTWNAPSFDRTYLGFTKIELNGFLTKTKKVMMEIVQNIINEYCFFCFCEETIQFDAGKTEMCAIIPCDPFHVTGRLISNGPHFPGAENPTANCAGQR
jgi:hypothetical protein